MTFRTNFFRRGQNLATNLPIRTNQGFHLKFLEYNSSPDLNKIDYFSELCGNFSQISQNWTSLSKDAKKMLKFRTILIYLKETAEFCKFGILWNAFLIIRSTSLLNWKQRHTLRFQFDWRKKQRVYINFSSCFINWLVFGRLGLCIEYLVRFSTQLVSLKYFITVSTYICSNHSNFYLCV